MTDLTRQPGEIDTSYEPFSREPEYIELNRDFIRSLGLGGRVRLLDLACGTGTLTGLALDVPGCAIDAVGIDLNRRSLMLARQDLGLDPAGGKAAPRVALVEASADRLPVAGGWADVVLIGNAIHCLPDLGQFFDEVRRVLRPGGRFAFNSSFYAGTFVPGTERFYDEWLKESVRYLRDLEAEARKSGKAAFRRVRGTMKPAGSRRWHSPAEFRALLEARGFAVTAVNQRTVMMTQHSFETVGAFEGLAAVLLSGYPVDAACEALTRSVGPGLRAVGMEEVPRYWLEMAAVRGGGAA